MERILKKNKKKKDKKLSKAKIVVGVPCWSHMYESMESSLHSLMSHPSVIGRVKSSGALVYEARNEIVRNALTQFPDMTHLLFIDSDMTFSQECLTYLVEAKKHIISGVTNRRTPPFEPCYLADEESLGSRLIDALKVPVKEQKPFEVDGVGMAFTLIDKKVLLRKHWNTDELWFYPTKDKEGKPKGEDYSFCDEAKDMGYKVWVHPSCIVGHLTEYVISVRDWLQMRQGGGPVEQDKSEE